MGNQPVALLTLWDIYQRMLAGQPPLRPYVVVAVTARGNEVCLSAWGWIELRAKCAAWRKRNPGLVVAARNYFCGGKRVDYSFGPTARGAYRADAALLGEVSSG